MLSLTLIFRNSIWRHGVRIGGGRFLNQLRSPQSSSDSPLEQAGSNRQYGVRRPRFRERGLCRLSLPQRRRRRDETRYHDDGGGLPLHAAVVLRRELAEFTAEKSGEFGPLLRTVSVAPPSREWMSGSYQTRRWRKPDSNHRSRGRPPPSS